MVHKKSKFQDTKYSTSKRMEKIFIKMESEHLRKLFAEKNPIFLGDAKCIYIIFLSGRDWGHRVHDIPQV
jgi:hypothetical protein